MNEIDVAERITNGAYEHKLPYRSPKEDRAAYDAYNRETDAINKLFRSDLEKQYGMKRNSKAQTLWNMAWDAGHASGYYEVFAHYQNFVDLVKKERAPKEKPLDVQGLLAAVEFGYMRCEKGMNLQSALIEAQKVLLGRS